MSVAEPAVVRGEDTPDAEGNVGLIPRSIEELTPAWLTRALRETYPGVGIRGFEIDHVIHGTSSKIFMQLDRDEAAIAAGLPDRMCLKVNWEPHAVQTLSWAVWCKEGQFYRYLRPHLPAPAPAGYYGSYNKQTGQGLVIMEDLAAQGATFGDNTRPLTPDQAAAALDDLADLHAAWWGSPKLDHFTWLAASMEGPNVVDHWGGAQGMARLTEAPERAATMSREVDNPELWVKAMTRLVESEADHPLPRCLIHGDTHLGNSYYLPGKTLQWLDWQLTCKGRPARELNYFLGCGLDVATRRASERDLILHYFECLKKRGIEPPPFDDFWRDYRQWAIQGLLFWAVTGDGWQPVPTILETMRRFAVAIEDHETFKGL